MSWNCSRRLESGAEGPERAEDLGLSKGPLCPEGPKGLEVSKGPKDSVGTQGPEDTKVRGVQKGPKRIQKAVNILKVLKVLIIPMFLHIPKALKIQTLLNVLKVAEGVKGGNSPKVLKVLKAPR